jgi:hypothetical protein
VVSIPIFVLCIGNTNLSYSLIISPHVVPPIVPVANYSDRSSHGYQALQLGNLSEHMSPREECEGTVMEQVVYPNLRSHDLLQQYIYSTYIEAMVYFVMLSHMNYQDGLTYISDAVDVFHDVAVGQDDSFGLPYGK